MKIKFFIFWLIAFLGPLVLIEGVSRLFSYPASFDYIERRLIEQNFQSRKAKDEFRIFLLGESTIHGQYLFPNSTIARWMEIYLQHLLPPETARNIKIYNLGRLGEDSFFITQAFLDTIPLQPDLVVLYTSHNDFVQMENRIKNLNRNWKDHVYNGFINLTKKSAFISGLRRAAVKRRLLRRRREVLAEAEEDRWYDHLRRKDEPNLTKGLLPPGGEQSRAIQKMLEDNIDKIIHHARCHHIPVVFFGPLSRFDAYKPFASSHADGMSAQQLVRWGEIHAQAEQTFAQQNYALAVQLYQQALEVDPDYALTYFRLGECYKRLGRYDKAKVFYRQANDRDYFPLRAPSSVFAFYRRLRQKYPGEVFVIDTQQLFEAHAPYGMIDITLVIDQMHPTMRGQALMAGAVCRVMDTQGLLRRPVQWQWQSLLPYEFLKQEIRTDDDFRFRALMSSANYVGSYYEKAIEFLEQALKIRPDSVAARSQLAWTLYKAGRLKEAARLYQGLRQDVPRLADKFFNAYPEFDPQTLRQSAQP